MVLAGLGKIPKNKNWWSMTEITVRGIYVIVIPKKQKANRINIK